MSDRNRDELRDLVALLALDALDGDERAVAESAVARDDELRAELDAHLRVAAILAESVEHRPSTPSPGVWAHIRAEVEGSDRPTPELASVTEVRRLRSWARAAIGVSVAAVLVSAMLALRLAHVTGEVGGEALDRAAAAKVAEPGAEVVTLVGQEGHESAEARVVLGDDGVGYLLADSLPALDPERTYQLWAIVADGGGNKVISAGVLGNDPGIAPFQAVGDVAGFAITEEVAGGVVVSQGDTIAVWLAEA